MYNFYKDITCSGKIVTARKVKDNTRSTEYKLQKVERPRVYSKYATLRVVASWVPEVWQYALLQCIV